MIEESGRRTAMQEPKDLLDATTETSYKCPSCGNMFPVAQVSCDVCGHDCTADTCRIVKVSNEDY
jgi:hypothetical protein